jgi:hypothetical protein
MVDLEKLDQDVKAYEFKAESNKILNIAITLGAVCAIVYVIINLLINIWT